MNIVDQILKEQKLNLRDYFFCFDYDEVIAYRSWKELSRDYHSALLKILKYRKKNKKDFFTSGKSLGYTEESLVDILDKAVNVNKLNSKIVDFLYDIYNNNGNLVICSNNVPEFIDRCLKKHKIDNFFIYKHSPEFADWTWKPDETYFKILKNKLRTTYEKMVLYDDLRENIELFRILGGYGIFYRKWEMPFKYPKEWR